MRGEEGCAVRVGAVACKRQLDMREKRRVSGTAFGDQVVKLLVRGVHIQSFVVCCSASIVEIIQLLMQFRRNQKRRSPSRGRAAGFRFVASEGHIVGDHLARRGRLVEPGGSLLMLGESLADC